MITDFDMLYTLQDQVLSPWGEDWNDKIFSQAKIKTVHQRQSCAKSIALEESNANC